MVLDEYRLQVATFLCDHRGCHVQTTFTGQDIQSVYRMAHEQGWRFWRSENAPDTRQHWCPQHEVAHRTHGPWVNLPEGRAVYPVGQNPNRKKRQKKRRSPAPKERR